MKTKHLERISKCCNIVMGATSQDIAVTAREFGDGRVVPFWIWQVPNQLIGQRYP
jgi:hypothetical protein